MDTGFGIVGVICEILTLLGLIVGIIVLFAAGIAWIVDGTWERTEAILVGEPPTAHARWLDHHRELHDQPLTDAEFEHLAADSDPAVYCSRRRPDRMRLDAGSHGVRLLVTLGLVLSVIGLLAGAGSIVLLFVEG